jgi:nitrate/TMAO reductase-like tetraheme cytochrome c subunit
VEQGKNPMEHNKRHREKLLFLMFAGALGIILLVIGGYKLVEFSDSTAFCGRLCHNIMYPEYTTYQASPHSRVLCSECHVGPGASYLVKSKINGVPMILSTISGNVDRPIPVPVQNLRPARETCEQCHRPEKFSGDVVRVHTTFVTDETNTQKTDTRVLRVGGGEDSVASDIHWHIAASVWYLPTDDKRQVIDWVGVEGSDGKYVSEYINPKTPDQVTPEQIEKGKRLMDCIDCHNRATHVFQSPEQLIDAAMAQGKIDKTLPYIKKEGSNLLYPVNSSLAEAYKKIEGITEFYRINYPQVFKEKKDAIDKAIIELKEVARLTTFPDMKVSWESYDNNMGHQSSEGCFRCHGKLVESEGSQTGKTINASCDLCHYPITSQ